jgi:hypothetical protein
MPEKILTYLANINKHQRDDAIQRESRISEKSGESYDVWTIHGDAFYKGVTSYVASLFQEFDADAVIDKMMASPKWSESKYFGMEKEEIKKMWSDKGKKAADDGTAMHYSIECFYNNEDLASSSDENERKLLENDEYKQFMEFHNDIVLKNNMKPYRTEWLVYHEEMKFKGIIDMLYENEDGSLSIYDWKRVDNLTKYNRWQSAKEPVSHIPDSNYWHYCLQLNIYKRILEEKYGKIVKDMYLVCLHPTEKTYKRVRVISMDYDISMLFEKRASYLEYVANKKKCETDKKCEEKTSDKDCESDKKCEEETSDKKCED